MLASGPGGAFQQVHPTDRALPLWVAGPWVRESGSSPSEGGPFLFKTKRPGALPGVDIPPYSWIGGGFFEEYFEMPVSRAWAIWGQSNGVESEQELLRRVQGTAMRRGIPSTPTRPFEATSAPTRGS